MATRISNKESFNKVAPDTGKPLRTGKVQNYTVMQTTLTRLSAFIISLTIPLSASAYFYKQFDVESITNNADVQTGTETDKEVQQQKWDTECREKQGIPGGDVLGALRFNLNRCINNKRRKAERVQMRLRSSIRTTQYLETRTQTSNRFEGIVRYTRRTLKQQIKKKSSFYNTMPQNRVDRRKSFENARLRRRLSVQQKEQEIKRDEKRRSYYVRDARKACRGTQATERANCIKDKIEELKAADTN